MQYDSFSEWQTAGQKKMLLEELQFASDLYETSEREPERTTTRRSPSSVKDFLYQLRQYPLDQRDLVSWNGISVDWLLDVLFQLPFFKVLLSYDCDVWFVRKVCIIEALRRRNVSSGPLVIHLEIFEGMDTKDSATNERPDTASQTTRAPDIFVSYTGRYKFAYFVEMLHKLRGQWAWIDLFCVDQFAWTGRSKDEELGNFREKLQKSLGRQIQRIGALTLMVETWTDLMPTLKHMWVLWEVFNAVKVGASFSMLVSDSEQQRYLKALSTGNEDFEKIQNALLEINCAKGETEDDADRHSILQLMAREGFYNVDCTVTQKFREWLIDNGKRSNRSLEYPGYAFQHNLAVLLFQQGDFEGAETIGRIALTQKQNALGPVHTSTLSAMCNVANTLMSNGKEEEGEHIFREALRLSDQTYEESGSTTQDVMVELASCLAKRRNFAEAKDLLEKVLRALPDIDTCEAQSFEGLRINNNYANILASLGKREEAEQIFRKVLKARRTVLGEGHAQTLKTQHNLALLLEEQEKYAEAEPMMLENLELGRRLHGNDHEDTILSKDLLAGLYCAIGKADEAEMLYSDVVATSRRVFGHKSTNTIRHIYNLGSFLCDEGRLKEARSFLTTAYDGYRDLFGTNDPMTLQVMDSLAFLCAEEGDFKRSEELYRGVLIERRKQDEPNYPEVIQSVTNLASALEDQQAFAESEALYSEAVALARRAFASPNEAIVESLANLSNILSAQANFTPAIDCLTEAVEICKDSYGEFHDDTLDYMSNLAFLHTESGQLEDAERIGREALEARRAAFGDTHDRTYLFACNLATILELREKKEEAIRLLRKYVTQVDETQSTDIDESILETMREKLSHLNANSPSSTIT